MNRNPPPPPIDRKPPPPPGPPERRPNVEDRPNGGTDTHFQVAGRRVLMMQPAKPPHLRTFDADFEIDFDTLKRVQQIPGVQHAQLSRYRLIVTRGRLFTWDAIVPEILAALRRPAERAVKFADPQGAATVREPSS